MEFQGQAFDLAGRLGACLDRIDALADRHEGQLRSLDLQAKRLDKLDTEAGKAASADAMPWREIDNGTAARQSLANRLNEHCSLIMDVQIKLGASITAIDDRIDDLASTFADQRLAPGNALGFGSLSGPADPRNA